MPAVYMTTRGPSFADLRPAGEPVDAGADFPVYDKLVDRLARPSDTPDDVVRHVLATCCGYAYGDKDVVAMMLARMGLERANLAEIAMSVDAMLLRSTAYIVQSKDGRIVILCYRGTPPLDLISWALDAEIEPEQVDIGRAGDPLRGDVHGGFYRNVRAIRSEVVKALLRAVEGRSIVRGGRGVVKPLEALYITGHSLGGAMALLMAMMLRKTQPGTDYGKIADKLVAVYTFGQPMVASRQLADDLQQDQFFRNKLVRHIYNRDVIPQLPPLGDYAHFGQEYQYDVNAGCWRRSERLTAQLTDRQAWLDVVATLTSLWRPARAVALFEGRVGITQRVHDHYPVRYVAAAAPSGKTEFDAQRQYNILGIRSTANGQKRKL
jgi:Lipase (class 3)